MNTTYAFEDDLDVMERDDLAFEQGRRSLLDDPDDLVDTDLDLFDAPDEEEMEDDDWL